MKRQAELPQAICGILGGQPCLSMSCRHLSPDENAAAHAAAAGHA